MSELKAIYNTAADDLAEAGYVAEAVEMLGKGYDQPTVIVEPPRTITTRKNGRMVEVEEPAWVKFSTDFKAELKGLNEYSLKVFLYIGLSVNWQTGTAWPGIRRIATDCDIAQNTAANAIKDLEQRGFLEVTRKEKSSNVYRTIRYLSVGKSASPDDADGNLPHEKTNLPHQNENLPHAHEGILHNKNNKSQLDSSEISKITEQANRTVDAFLDQERQAVGKITYPKRESLPECIRDLIDEFVRASGIKPISKDMLNWLQAGNDWMEIGAQPKDIGPAYLVAKEKYTVYSPNSITKELQLYKAQPEIAVKKYDEDYL